jgi:pimeloyl-ACP methyl ester carboxylesterase
MKRRIIRWLKIIALIYVVVGLALYILQDKLLFHPVFVAKNKSYGFPYAYREMTIPYDQETRLNIIRFLTQDSSRTKGIVLYFHGNAKNIAWYAKYSTNFTRNHYEVWMIDYPGFGKKPGCLRKPGFTIIPCSYTRWPAAVSAEKTSSSTERAWAPAWPASWHRSGTANT